MSPKLRVYLSEMKLNFGIRILTSLTIFIVLSSAFLVSLDTNDRVQRIGYGIDVTFAGISNHAFNSDSIGAMRKWHTYVLGADSVRNEKMFRAAKNELSEIKSLCDTVRGVQFILDSNATYADFIRALDVCMSQRPTWAVPDGNKVMGYYSNENPNYWRRKPFDYFNSDGSRWGCIRCDY